MNNIIEVYNSINDILDDIRNDPDARRLDELLNELGIADHVYITIGFNDTGPQNNDLLSRLRWCLRGRIFLLRACYGGIGLALCWVWGECYTHIVCTL